MVAHLTSHILNPRILVVQQAPTTPDLRPRRAIAQLRIPVPTLEGQVPTPVPVEAGAARGQGLRLELAELQALRAAQRAPGNRELFPAGWEEEGERQAPC